MTKRDIGQEILDGIREIKAHKTGGKPLISHQLSEPSPPQVIRISLHTSLEFNNKQQDKLFFSTSLTALLYAAPEYRINAERS